VNSNDHPKALTAEPPDLTLLCKQYQSRASMLTITPKTKKKQNAPSRHRHTTKMKNIKETVPFR
jgi:hypothetical protein